MLKSFFTELFANIRATIVSFCSIIMFVTLAVSLFLGIRASATSLENAAEQTFATGAFHDLDILFPYGLSQEDLAAIARIPGIDRVEPSYLAYVAHDVAGDAHAMSVHSLTTSMDLTTVSEGRLPTQAGEAVIGEGYADEQGIAVGDTIELVPDATDEADPDGMRYLTTSTLTITGIASNPNYIAKVGGMLGVSDAGQALESFAYVTKDSFDIAAFQGLYPRVAIRSSELRGMRTFSKRYRERIEQLKADVVALGEPKAKARYQAIVDTAQTQIDEAQAQIDEGEALLADARQQIQEGEAAIASGQAQIDAAIAQLESSQATYATTEAQVSSILATMRAGVAEVRSVRDQALAELKERSDYLDGIRAQIKAMQERLDAVDAAIGEEQGQIEELDAQLAGDLITSEEYQAELQRRCDRLNEPVNAYLTALTQLAPALNERYPQLQEIEPVSPSSYHTALMTWPSVHLALARALDMARQFADDIRSQVDELNERANQLSAQLEGAISRYEAAESQAWAALAAARSQLESVRTQISEGQSTLAEKTDQLEQGKRTYAEKSAELEEGKGALLDAREQVGQLTYMSWIVNTRFMSSGTISLMNIVNLTRSLRVAMASLFVAVGLFVCYSAIARIVHEQVRQIGTKKALGFRGREITASYLAYTGIAVAIGVTLGVAASYYVVQGILVGALARSFDLPPIVKVVEPFQVAFIALVEALLLLAVTWLACRAILRRSAVDLLAGEQTGNETPHFYERWELWRRLPLLTKTVINNCMSDSRRVFATVVGVAGCTSLIVSAATLDGNITKSLTEQFGRVYDYDITVSFDSTVDGAEANLTAALDRLGCSHTPVRKTMYLLDDAGGEPAYEFVHIPADEASFAELFHLDVVPTTGTAPTRGVWVSQSHAAHRGTHVGDTLTVCTVAGERYDLAIAGFFTYYLPYNTIVMSPDYYREVVGMEPTANALLVAWNGVDPATVRRELAAQDGFVSITDEHESAQTMVKLFKSITTTVVGIYIGLSALMAIIVLLNLDYMYIDEKKRELIVLMICGFSVRDAKGYIYRDTIVMTILGVALGVVLGVVVGSATVAAIEWQSCSFIKDVYPPACLLGIGMSTAFSAAMMLVALRRIPRFSLTDIARY